MENNLKISTEDQIYPKQPDFVIALEFKDLCGRRSLSDTISKKLNNSIVAADLEKILEKEQNNILLVLDGYDEQLKHCQDKTMMADVIEIIQGEHDRNFNLIVTTRPWKSELLRGYDTMKIKSKWNKATRNQSKCSRW